MENKSGKKYKWKDIFLWSLLMMFTFFASIITRHFIREYSDFYDEIIFWIPSVISMLWGVIAGFAGKDNKNLFYKYIAIKSPFLTLLFSSLLMLVATSIIINIIDPVDGNYIHKIIGTISLPVVFTAALMVGPFFGGYIISISLRILLDLCKKIFAKSRAY